MSIEELQTAEETLWESYRRHRSAADQAYERQSGVCIETVFREWQDATRRLTAREAELTRRFIVFESEAQ